MAITTTLISGSRAGFLSGAFAAADVYRLALIKTGHTGTYDQTFGKGYWPTNIEECVGTGSYTTSGSTLAGYTMNMTAGTASIDWNNIQYAAANLCADGACLYKSGTGGWHPVIGFVDFGGTKVASGGNFDITIADLVKLF